MSMPSLSILSISGTFPLVWKPFATVNYVLVTKPLADSEAAARQLADEAKIRVLLIWCRLNIGLEIPASIWTNWLNRDISESSIMLKLAVSAEMESQSGKVKINST
jgi:hypothetical protein